MQSVYNLRQPPMGHCSALVARCTLGASGEQPLGVRTLTTVRAGIPRTRRRLTLGFQFVDHTGDTAVVLRAESEAALLGHAARALCAILIDVDRSRLEPCIECDVSLEAEDGESLLVDFLNELVFLFDSQRFLPISLRISQLTLERPFRLRATVVGDTYSPDRHQFLTEVKAATFHGVEIRRSSTGVSTTVVFDL